MIRILSLAVTMAMSCGCSSRRAGPLAGAGRSLNGLKSKNDRHSAYEARFNRVRPNTSFAVVYTRGTLYIYNFNARRTPSLRLHGFNRKTSLKRDLSF